MKTRHSALVEGLPDTPGVYLHLDEMGRVLYIGKAKNLRGRVRSYFQPSSDHGPRIAAVVRLVREVKIIQTHTEAEALILEANLIKKHQPRYNVHLKDDKSYPFFKLTMNELFPRLFLVREKREKEAEYYGPYTSAKDARETLNVVNRYFKLRTSKMTLDGSRSYRPCLNFQLRKCLAPCRGTVAAGEYREVVKKVRLFLQGRDKELQAALESEMEELARERRYEEAAQARNAIAAVRRTLQKQLVVAPDPKANQDVLALHRESHFAGVQLLFIRHGRLIGSDFMAMERTEEMEEGEIIGAVMRNLYTRPSVLLPREVLIPYDFEDRKILEDFLSSEKGAKVSITLVKRGAKMKLIDMARENARRALTERINRRRDDEAVLEESRRELHLRRLPERVEAFDISNISGTHTVASMVVWLNNQPLKKDYRKYKIRQVKGGDDFMAMHEVLSRRYRRAVSGEQPLPDLILIDGGKGQVNIARHVLDSLGISPTQVDLVGLAKGRSEKRKRGSRRGEDDLEYVVTPERKYELRLKKNSAALHFLQRIRDESHRFAITFNRSLRKRETLRSELEELPGLGKKRVQQLLRHFGSLARIRKAELEELQAMPGLPEKVAQTIHAAYQGNPPGKSADKSSRLSA